MEQQDYILFEDYLSENLSKDEVAVFEKKLKTDNAFAEEFQTYKDLSSFLDDKFRNEEETKSFKQNLKFISDRHFIENEETTEEKVGSKTLSLFKYMIAACIVIMFGVVALNQFLSPTYSDFNNYETISLTVRGENDNLLKTAEKAFNTKDFASAEKAFKKLIESDKDNAELKLYRAITNIELNNFEVSDSLFEDLRRGNSVYKNKATWYLALSKLKQDDETTCITILKAIPEGADDYKQAQKLLDKLD